MRATLNPKVQGSIPCGGMAKAPHDGAFLLRAANRVNGRGHASVRAMLAILDGTVTDASQAQIPATDDGFLRGDGVFEVMRLYGGRLFAFDDHLTRLAARRPTCASRSTSTPCAPTWRRWSSATTSWTPRCASWSRAAGTGWRWSRSSSRCPTRWPSPPSSTPPRACSTRSSRSPTAANMLARRLAQEQGADDALLVTPHGRVLEGPTRRSCARSTARRSSRRRWPSTSSTRSRAATCSRSST